MTNTTATSTSLVDLLQEPTGSPRMSDIFDRAAIDGYQLDYINEDGDETPCRSGCCFLYPTSPTEGIVLDDGYKSTVSLDVNDFGCIDSVSDGESVTFVPRQSMIAPPKEDLTRQIVQAAEDLISEEEQGD